MPDDLRTLLAELYVRFDLESLRAVEAWQWSSRLHAARTHRDHVRREDVLAVAPLVLHHRLEPETLGDLLRALREERPAAAEMAASAAEAQLGPDDGPVGGPGPDGRLRRPGMGRHDQLPGDLTGGRHGRHTLLSRLRALLQGDERRPDAYHRRGGTGSMGDHGPGRGGPGQGTGSGGDHGAAGSGGRDGTGHRPEVPAPPHPARPLHLLPVADIVARLGYGGAVPPEHRRQVPPQHPQVPPQPRKEDRAGDHGAGR